MTTGTRSRPRSCSTRPQFAPDAAAGLDAFSHIEVIFHFDRADPAKINTGARHPRGNTAWPKVGIFAQRGKDRPNRIGVTVCRILSVDGLSLRVRGARRHRRHAGARHQAGDDRLPAARRHPRAGLGCGAHGGLLAARFLTISSALNVTRRALRSKFADCGIGARRAASCAPSARRIASMLQRVRVAGRRSHPWVPHVLGPQDLETLKSTLQHFSEAPSPPGPVGAGRHRRHEKSSQNCNSIRWLRT